MTRFFLCLAALLLISSCSGTGPIRYELPPVTGGDRIPVSVGSVEVREVSLPLYAELETISVEMASGQLASDADLLWADDPRRSFTQGIALALASITNARVASEPWPFSEQPDVRVEVRFAQALAMANGQFRIAGQYFVASPFGERRDVARRFDLSIPYVPGDLGSVARAKGAAINALARQIAHDGL